MIVDEDFGRRSPRSSVHGRGARGILEHQLEVGEGGVALQHCRQVHRLDVPVPVSVLLVLAGASCGGPPFNIIDGGRQRVQAVITCPDGDMQQFQIAGVEGELFSMTTP